MNPKTLGIICLIGTGLIYAVGSAIIRPISAEFAVFQQLIFRSFITALALFAIGIPIKAFKHITARDAGLFFISGTVSFLDFALFIYAVNNLTLGLTLFTWYASAIVAQYIFGNIVFHEKLTPQKTMSLVLATLGLLLIYANGFTGFSLLPFLAALGAGVGFGISIGLSKGLVKNYSITQVGLVLMLVILAWSLLFSPIEGPLVLSDISMSAWMWLLLHVGLSVLVRYTLLYGYKVVEAQIASILLLSEVVFALILGYLYFSEVPTLFTLLGGVFVLGALVVPNVKVRRVKVKVSSTRK